MKHHLLSTITPPTLRVFLCFLFTLSIFSFADNTDVAATPGEQMALLNLTLRDLTFPPGYMDRAPKEHRPYVNDFCTNCNIDNSKARLFHDRAVLVNYFKLSTPDAIGLGDEDAVSSAPSHKSAPVNNSIGSKKSSWLRSL